MPPGAARVLNIFEVFDRGKELSETLLHIGEGYVVHGLTSGGQVSQIGAEVVERAGEFALVTADLHPDLSGGLAST
jgi:hypothetical protein